MDARVFWKTVTVDRSEFLARLLESYPQLQPRVPAEILTQLRR